MRSKELTKHMREGKWTAERIHSTLTDVSLDYLKQVLANRMRPSNELAVAIKNTVCKQPTLVDVTDLFPSMKENLPVSSIDTMASSSRHSVLVPKRSTAHTLHRSGAIRAHG